MTRSPHHRGRAARRPAGRARHRADRREGPPRPRADRRGRALAGGRLVRLTRAGCRRWPTPARCCGAAAGRAGSLHTLVFTERGAQQAIDAGARSVRLVVSASDGHSTANAGVPTAAALDRLAGCARLLTAAGVAIEASVATAFVCPFDGDTDPDRIGRRRRPARCDGRAGGPPRRHDRRRPAGPAARDGGRGARRAAGRAARPPPAQHLRPRGGERVGRSSASASAGSTRLWAASAAARSPRARPATSPRTTSSTSSTAKASRRESTW